ncbi:homeodomain-interacting protein kinase 1-like [Etheostoma cragini]|uniref:homeodomain-interacting protein kinase 1-like n=1 Tax=Etheostoma cragini TaxID=417921 RepID=UPI00155EB377|nr:homeodomain-interacting protein kinase 1-like [Etheostoma cragini]
MDFQVFVGEMITSSSSQYEVQDLLGSGSFGAVTQCRKVATNEMVALKICKNKKLIEEAKEEASILHILKELGSDQFNIVKWHDSFAFEGRYYLEFEELDISLTEFLQMSPSKSLELTDVRPIVQQLATALEFLKSTGFAHSDLKPENIMMVDHVRQPLRVKVIDFGLALNHPENWTGATLQTRWYRAPEILLGAPFNEAIDVWSLGCIAAEMLMGTALFPGCDNYDMMRHINLIVGKAPDHILNDGMYTRQYFRPNYHILKPPFWTFMSSLEKRHYTFTPCTIKSLSDVTKVPANLSSQDASTHDCDRVSFADLLKKLLDVDALQRIKPSQILQHPFITTSHLHVKTCVCGGENVAKEEISDSTASPACHPDESHPAGRRSKEHPSLQSVVISGENPPPKKRKGDSNEDSECGNRQTTKKRRSEVLDEEKDAQISPQSEKKCVEVKSLCQDLSVYGGKDVAKKDASNSAATEHPVLRSAVISGDNTPSKKRRYGDEDSECGNRSPAKKRRSESLDAAVKDAQISPKTSRLPKRKRDKKDMSMTSDISSRPKRTVKPEKELKEVLSHPTRPGPALPRRVGAIKRLPVQKKKNPLPHKRKRGSLDGGE